MFKSLRLQTKTMLAMGAAIVLVTALLAFGNLAIISRMIQESEEKTLDAYRNDMSTRIADEARLAESMAVLLANMPGVQERFANADRKALQDFLMPSFKILKERYGLWQLHFHTPPATSFLRLHKPDLFGDDLSKNRPTIMAVHNTHKPIRGLEFGMAGLGARGIVPMMHKGTQIGTLEFGMSFGQAFFDLFKEKNGVDTAFHVTKGAGFETLASTFGNTPLLSAEVLNNALAGKAQFGRTEYKNKLHAVSAHVITDYSGKPLGVVEIAMPSTYEDSISEARKTAAMLGIAALVLGLFLSWVIAHNLVRRIKSVVEGVNHIAEGDLTRKILTEGGDEIGALATSACEMRLKIHELASEVKALSWRVNTAILEIAGNISSQAAASTEMSTSVAEITSTMEEFTASTNQIAEHAHIVMQVAGQTLEGSNQGAQAMRQVQESMEEIQRGNQLSLEEIVQLGARSKNISKVMSIINAIANQTRLIAFNAALEASSAGEAGRRFSVVAAEIRRLADSVTDSTSEIESITLEIQNGISRLVITAEKGTQGIIDGSKASVNSAAILEQLVSSAENANQAASQISASADQQRIAANQVLVALREILGASSTTAKSISQISAISKELSVLSTRLTSASSKFKLKDETSQIP